MKSIKLLSIVMLLTVLLTLASAVTPAQASPRAIGVSGVSPSWVVNTQAYVLTVSGAEFVDGAVVSLDGAGSLVTTFVSDTSLSAALPVGFPAGVYTVRATNPDTSTAALPNALTVLDPTPTTAPPEPTSTATPPPAYARPLLVINSYSTSSDTISPGQDFTLYVKLRNAGQTSARNVVVTFTPGDLIPRETGGVVALGTINAGATKEFAQPMTVSSSVWSSLASLTMIVTYTDQDGASYTETFTLSLALYFPYVPAANTPTPTPTPTLTPTPTSTGTPIPTQVRRPQLVITSYSVSVDKLQPGVQFILQLTVQNMGSADAHRVTMISGGGSSGSSGGTPDPGGTSGAGGEFTNFAPLGSSNIQSLGEMPSGYTLSAAQPLIVNVTTSPGAYPFKVSFTYTDDNNLVFNDDQVITLLVYSLPVVDISFYQQVGQLTAGQPNLLPLQVVNLGRRSVVLGNMRVESTGGFLENNTILVGALETGGYFTLDATIYPDQAGPLEVTVYVDYTDDFNQPQVLSKTLTLDVMEGYVPEPGGEGEGNGNGNGNGEGGAPTTPTDAPETFWQKLWRFVLGLLGLDSGRPQAPGAPEAVPSEEPLPSKPEGKG